MKKLLIALILSSSLLHAGDRTDIQRLEKTIHKLARKSAFNRYVVVPFAVYGAYTAANNAYQDKEALKKQIADLNHKLKTGQEPKESLRKLRRTIIDGYLEIAREINGDIEPEKKEATLQDVRSKAAETVETLKAAINNPENSTAVKAKIEEAATGASEAFKQIKAAVIGQQEKTDDKKDDESK